MVFKKSFSKLESWKKKKGSSYIWANTVLLYIILYLKVYIATSELIRVSVRRLRLNQFYEPKLVSLVCASFVQVWCFLNIL